MFQPPKKKENIIFISYDENTQDSDVAEKISKKVLASEVIFIKNIFKVERTALSR